MTCPKCQANQDKVKDSRELERGRVIRRRRTCDCGYRWTTFERVATAPARPKKPRKPRVYAHNHYIL